MDSRFIPTDTVPSKTPFGLDQLRRSYKTDLSSEAAIAAAPDVGTADESFPNMFLMPISTPESARSATQIDLLYMGCLAGAEGDPTLPDQKHDESMAVQSASSSKASNGTVLTSPATLQYYSPSSVLTYFSFGAPGTTEAPAPTIAPVVITLTISDTTYTGSSIASSVNTLFSLQTISIIESYEVVPGQYWQNVARKNIIYSPFIFDLASGPYLFLSVAGVGYAVGNTLTISSGGEGATIVVDSVGAVFGGGAGILSFHTTANTFTVGYASLVASGGSPSTPAEFGVFIVP